MTPSSQFNGNNGVWDYFLIIGGVVASKAAGIDYKTLLKICITILTLVAGWGVNHLINCMDKIDANQMSIVRTQGTIIAQISRSDEWTKGQFENLKQAIEVQHKAIETHINGTKR